MEATMPMKASERFTVIHSHNGPFCQRTQGLRKEKDGREGKMNPVEACVAPVVADVAMFTSEGDHFSAMPRR